MCTRRNCGRTYEQGGEDVGRHKALVRRLFDEVFSAENLAAVDEIMAEDYIEHAVAPFGSDEPGRVHGLHTRTAPSSGCGRSSRISR